MYLFAANISRESHGCARFASYFLAPSYIVILKSKHSAYRFFISYVVTIAFYCSCRNLKTKLADSEETLETFQTRWRDGEILPRSCSFQRDVLFHYFNADVNIIAFHYVSIMPVANTRVRVIAGSTARARACGMLVLLILVNLARRNSGCRVSSIM